MTQDGCVPATFVIDSDGCSAWRAGALSTSSVPGAAGVGAECPVFVTAAGPGRRRRRPSHAISSDLREFCLAIYRLSRQGANQLLSRATSRVLPVHVGRVDTDSFFGAIVRDATLAMVCSWFKLAGPPSRLEEDGSRAESRANPHPDMARRQLNQFAGR
jgi:hypothetical protein